MKVIKNRYAVLANFILLFLLVSLLTRTAFLLISWSKADIDVGSIAKIYGKGMIFDTLVALFFSGGYALYLLLLPQQWNKSLFNRIITITSFFLAVLIVMFSIFAEFAFWNEFESRFNFIAVDYLIYTFEVVNNINQSYPLPWLISGMVLLAFSVTLFFYKRKIFLTSFQSNTHFKKRLEITGLLISFTVVGCYFVDNKWAESNQNRYQNELAKAGIFSFFAAFKNNELNYYDFYAKEDETSCFSIIKDQLSDPFTSFSSNSLTVLRQVDNPGISVKPNIILVSIESFSADFMKHFGNVKNLTPTLDSLADASILFTDMYATGTRTVRGMEALMLCVPPTPGNSIVRRMDNEHLYSVGSIFRKAGYATTFFYGGDGYFDNMNYFFSHNDFAITDKAERVLLNEKLPTPHHVIADTSIHFKNAWGICDEDLYDAVVSDADRQHQQNKSFFYFVMTTSNHRPYTYPSEKIDIPSGSGRDGAVKYTDYAIKQFITKIEKKPWFNNTVIIFVADHCASSAGKNEINVSRYHIPCLIYNLPDKKYGVIDEQCSQIDLFTTLFGLLHWDYSTISYGQNVLQPSYHPRAWIATYQQLGYLQSDTLITLSPQRKVGVFKWNRSTDELDTLSSNTKLTKEAIAGYQTAYYLYKNGGLKEKQ